METVDGQSEQQLRKKLHELMAKKAQVDNLLAYIESDHVAGNYDFKLWKWNNALRLLHRSNNWKQFFLVEAIASLSSDDGEGVTYARAHVSLLFHIVIPSQPIAKCLKFFNEFRETGKRFLGGTWQNRTIESRPLPLIFTWRNCKS